jgi:hypothetical protein
MRPSQNNSSQKRAGGVAQSVGIEFKPQYCKKKKKKFALICLGAEMRKRGSSTNF